MAIDPVSRWREARAVAGTAATRELRVDGEQSDAAIPPELAELGEAAGADYFVEALRIDGDLWEVRVTAF